MTEKMIDDREITWTLNKMIVFVGLAYLDEDGRMPILDPLQ